MTNKIILLIITAVLCYSNSLSQWTQAVNIPNRFVKAIVKCENNLFAGTSSGTLHIGEIYSSSNNGLSWSVVNVSFPFSGVFSMTVRENYIYAGTYEHGLLMSNDGGKSWVLNNINISLAPGVFGVGVSGENNVIAYINHGTGLALSTNLGYNWSNISPGNQISQLQVFLDLPGKLLAGSRKGVVISTNSGLNWSLQTNTGLEHYPDGTKPVRAIYYYNNKLFAGCIDQIYTSGDFGNSFTPTNFQLNNHEYYTSFVSLGNKLFASAYTFQSSSPGVIMTTNEGAIWTSYQNGDFTGKAVYALALSDEYLVAGTAQSGIWIHPLEKFTLSLKANLEAISLPDTISVELRNSVSPYNLIDSKNDIGNQNALSPFEFTNAVDGTPYYVVVKHRNSIATWSGSTQSFSQNAISYDFTTSASQAYGNNMVNSGGEWSFYSGDVNQDGTVDITDGSLIDNDILYFAAGYISTDLDGNGTVDITDAAYADNNAFNFTVQITP